MRPNASAKQDTANPSTARSHVLFNNSFVKALLDLSHQQIMAQRLQRQPQLVHDFSLQAGLNTVLILRFLLHYNSYFSGSGTRRTCHAPGCSQLTQQPLQETAHAVHADAVRISISLSAKFLFPPGSEAFSFSAPLWGDQRSLVRGSFLPHIFSSSFDPSFRLPAVKPLAVQLSSSRLLSKD